MARGTFRRGHRGQHLDALADDDRRRWRLGQRHWGTHGSLELPHGFGPGQLIVLLSSTLLVVGAMAGRGLSVKLSSIAALVVSLLIVALTVWYYKLNVNPPVSAEYGLYFGAAGGVCAVGCSLWAAVSAASPGRRRHREVVR